MSAWWHAPGNSSAPGQSNAPAHQQNQSSRMPNQPPYSHQQQQPYPNQSSTHSSIPNHSTASYPTFIDPVQRHPYQQNPYHPTQQFHGHQSFQYGQIPYNPSPYPSAPVRPPVSLNAATYYQGQQYTSLPVQYAPPSYYEATGPPGISPSFSEPVNLISNPNFEAKCWNANGDTVDINMAPWDIISTGGDGWRLEKRPMGSKVDSCPTAAGPSAHCVVGSFDWCKRSQIINLEEKGFSSYQLGQEKPRIHVYVWFIARSDCGSEYYMNVTLLDNDKKPIDHFNSGTLPATSEWQKVEHSFYNYPPGVCYIRYEDGTKDNSYWAGFYGAKICQPTVLIHSADHRTGSGPALGYAKPYGSPRVAVPGTQYPGASVPGTHYPGAPVPGTQYPGASVPGTHYPGASVPGTQYPGAHIHKDQLTYNRDQIVNLIKNPSFTPLEWDGDVCRSIDLSPWAIEKNGESYCLEKKPIGSEVDKYPKELDGFKVWCISTSNSFSQRKQVVDLIKHGFSPRCLDEERPAIAVHEWFTSRSDCKGRYFLKVALLDQQQNPIPGFSYDTGIKEAPSRCWLKEEYIFTNIPTGVRFIEFKDGGSDCKNWAGFYGAKMVGAFAGVLSNTLDHHHIAFSEKPKQSPKNLLKNGNLIPKTSWSGNVTSDIEFEPWEIIESGGDGIHLEKSPEGTAAGPFPREIGQNAHCIATSFGWFKRVQIIDLLKNGVFPHVFNNPDLMIHVCEWFASRTDNEGEYYLKVSLLDDRRQEIPGCTFDSHVSQAPSDEWEKVDYTFYPVPDSACYVRFEDGGKDVKVWAGKYGVKMIGAAVYAGQKHDNEDLDCTLM